MAYTSFLPFWLALVCVLAVLSGAAVALGLQIPVLVMIGAPALLIVSILVLPTSVWQQGGAVLLSLAAVALLGSYAMTFVARSGSVIANVWTAVAILCALPALVRWIKVDKIGQCVLLLYVAYLILTFASTAIGDIKLRAAAYQFIYNLKLPAMLLCGLGIGWSLQREEGVRKVLLVGVFLALAGVLIEIAAPGWYRAVAVGTGERSITPNPLLHGLLSRKSGPYVHSGVLAMNAAFAGSAFLIFLLNGTGKAALNVVGLACSVVLAVLAGQQQEALAFVCAIGLILVCMRTRPNFARLFLLVAALGLLVAALLLLLGSQQIGRLLDEWGIGPGLNAVTSARPVFFSDGTKLANDAFPLGIGLGRFGSIGAQLYDRGIYQSLGYGVFWWYRLDQFLLDTFWPNIYAESGWVGAAILLSTLVVLLVFSLGRWWEAPRGAVKGIWGLATTGQLLVLIGSATSPLYGDPSVCVWMLVWTGIALRLRMNDLQSNVRSQWK